MTPFLIIGLGNPGKEYDGTRHNVGFNAVDAISQNAECKMQNAKWRKRTTLHAEILECNIADHRVILVKPTTFMNESGHAASALVQSCRLSTVDCRLIVLHDDLDLPLGTLRLSRGGSSGGHKGVQSTIDALGTNDFLRLRIGIGPNVTPDGTRIPAEDFVLKRFGKRERAIIDATITHAVKTTTILLRDGLSAAQRFANVE
ncbi:aminoacyl-tRNA hydrolase [Candidatus Uhrbacteria bacterium]|nr:aminoacyl-tRNA hydrolase [Candidatus Uhrbacteria bacterium]